MVHYSYSLSARDKYISFLSGDIESMPIIETLCQLSFSVGEVLIICSLRVFADTIYEVISSPTYMLASLGLLCFYGNHEMQ